MISTALCVSKTAVSWQVRRDDHDVDEKTGGEDAGGEYNSE